METTSSLEVFYDFSLQDGRVARGEVPPGSRNPPPPTHCARPVVPSCMPVLASGLEWPACLSLGDALGGIGQPCPYLVSVSRMGH